MAVSRAPGEWTEWVALLAGVLDERSRWRFVPLLLAMLFASGRRTVTTWLRAAVLQRDDRDFDHFLQTVGREWLAVGEQVLVVKQVVTSSRVYGLNRLSLARRAAHPGGWSAVTCSVYGRDEVQTVKTFLATHATFGGPIRVVIVK